MPTLARFASASSEVGQARSLVFPGVTRGRVGEAEQRVASGVLDIDAFLAGGWPRGKLSELCGQRSSGRTTLALHLLATCTQRGETTAWIDAADALHPLSLVAAGVELPRVLWVRPRSGRDALRAAETVLLGNGFSFVVLDWGDDLPRVAGAAWWLRLQRAAARAQAVLLVLAPRSLAGSFAALRLHLSARGACWLDVGQRLVLQGLHTRVAVERQRTAPTAGGHLHWQARLASSPATSFAA